MYRLEEPIYFYFLAIIPIMVVVFLSVLWWKKRTQKRFSDIKLLEKIAPNTSIFKNTLKLIMLVLGISFLVISLVNPKMGSKLKTVKREGVDVVFALDVSKSMLAEDIKPNRLERARQAISRLIDKLEGDRIGLIVFAGDAYVQLPITTDYSAAKLFLSTVNTNIVPSQGTAIGKAIDLSIRSFDMEDGQNKAIIIITDGENHEDDALEQAKLANEKEVFVHTLGMGLSKGAPIPIYNKYGNNAGYRKDKEGNTIISKLNEQMLQEIASAGNGTYVRANNTQAGLSILFSEINKMEKKEEE